MVIVTPLVLLIFAVALAFYVNYVYAKPSAQAERMFAVTMFVTALILLLLTLFDVASVRVFPLSRG